MNIEELQEMADYYGWENWDEIEKQRIKQQAALDLLAEYEFDSRGMGI